MSEEVTTFWGHLEVLRVCLWRIIVAVLIGGIAAFCLKEELFSFVLAPTHGDFIVYRWLDAGDFNLHLINTGLTEQMMIHLKMALFAGVLVASPYIIYVLFGFVAPALYDNERRYSVRLVVSAYVMFIVGIIINYLVVFPFTVRFLGTYQVSSDIDNMLTISSYIDTLLMMSLTFGIVFEIPMLSWLLARFGLLKAEWMKAFRRHAFVAILIVAAVITPTTDIFTLFIVAMPIWLLYEMSIVIVGRAAPSISPKGENEVTDNAKM